MNARHWLPHGPVPRWPAALAVLAAVIALVLLFIFQQVVTGAVTQGAMRRNVAAQLHSATWQCKALRGAQARNDCLMLIPPADAAWLVAGGAPRPD